MRKLGLYEIAFVSGGEATSNTCTPSDPYGTGTPMFNQISATLTPASPMAANVEPGLGQIFPSPITTVVPVVIYVAVKTAEGAQRISDALWNVMNNISPWIARK